MYSPFNPYKFSDCTEEKVNVTNKWFAYDFAKIKGLKTKVTDNGTRRTFYKDDSFVGSVCTWPSNNGKFYAVNNNHEDGLFFTFEEAIKFATI